MKKLLLSTLTLTLIFAFTNKTYSQTKMTKTDSVLYSMAVLMANDYKTFGATTYNKELILKAFDQVMAGMPTDVTPVEASATLKEFRTSVLKAEGVNFLTENAKKPGVITLPSGLQYKILEAGTGVKPKASDNVTTHYQGSLVNGTVFDSSIKRGEPISFPCNGVIKGWQEALQLMPEGSKWELYIPSDLAYGERGAGGAIPPYAALIFEINLIKVN
jgi:FKBP-type peptidyl-prolyl cis-trans isomerase FklB